MKTQVVKFHETGAPDVLKLEKVDLVPPGALEVQIQVKALGLNRAEAMFRSGMYLEAPILPARIGYEAAGIVSAVGPGVTHFQVGDAVSTVPSFSMNQYGVYGETATVPEAAVVKHLSSLSWEEAASIWMQYLTAYGALVAIARLQPGETVLIPAASSSVGIAAIQIANQIGAIPVALTRTDKKRQQLLDAGAMHVIATETEDLVEAVFSITDGQGARVVFDPVGGPTLARLTSAMAQGGIYFIYGALSPDATPFPLFDVLAKSLTIRGYLVFEFTQNAATCASGIEFVNHGLRTGALKPMIARTFPLDQIAAAHEFLESNDQFGKVVVTNP